MQTLIIIIAMTTLIIATIIFGVIAAHKTSNNIISKIHFVYLEKLDNECEIEISKAMEYLEIVNSPFDN